MEGAPRVPALAPGEVSERMYDGLRKAGMPEGEAKTN